VRDTRLTCVTGRAQPLHVRAATDMDVFVVTRAHLRLVMGKNPGLEENLRAEITQRQQQAQQQQAQQQQAQQHMQHMQHMQQAQQGGQIQDDEAPPPLPPPPPAEVF
jgi:CRP-like cAMP-binding protein